MNNFALVFPGQGSQSVAMMKSFAEESVVKQTFERASQILSQDLWQLISEGPAEQLNATVNTQPIMLTAGFAIYEAWLKAGGPKPQWLGGHSLGEYTALVAAGVISFEDALPLVRFRAQVMQEAVPVGTGAMAAILGLSDERVKEACHEASAADPLQVVEAVNFNAPNQVVIAGTRQAVEAAAAACKAKGAKRALMLPVSAPFHSSLLKPAAMRLADYMQNLHFHPPLVTIVNNVDASVVSDPEAIKQSLARQAFNPVRWVELIRYMAAQGVTHVLECGPGKVLNGLTTRIEPHLKGFALTDPASLHLAMEALK